MTWYRLPVKVIAGFAVSAHPKAWVVHQIDPGFTNVSVWVEDPEIPPRYNIRMYCGKTFTRLFIFRRIPSNFKMCKRCTMIKTHGRFPIQPEPDQPADAPF